MRYQHRGDLLVKIVIEVPSNLTKTQERLIKKLSDIETNKTMPDKTEFAKKLKNRGKK